MSVSVVIPTYRREEVLVRTLEAILRQLSPDDELIVIDQTPLHSDETEAALQSLSQQGRINWVRQSPPSIPCAMNRGLMIASREIVLFLDDDIEPAPDLVSEHLQAHRDHCHVGAVVGQVLQPGEISAPSCVIRHSPGLREDLNFPFWSDGSTEIANVMAGNLSVKRTVALSIGGFDENFIGVAYRFETEFARRLIRNGKKIRFEPTASIQHLRAPGGGTRSKGSHLTSPSAIYGMGDYYFAMRQGWSFESMCYILRRPLREVSTRFHLRHPWYLPVKLLGESRAIIAALLAWRRGPKLLTGHNPRGQTAPVVPSSNSNLAVETRRA